MPTSKTGASSNVQGLPEIQPRLKSRFFKNFHGFWRSQRPSSIGQKGTLKNIKPSPFLLLAVKGVMSTQGVVNAPSAEPADAGLTYPLDLS
jgi:hypothetical protein